MEKRQILESVVNQVTLINTDNVTFIRKKYFTQSLRLGIPIDIRRSEVEARVLEALPSIMADYPIHTPRILSVSQNQIEMEYIKGNALNTYKDPFFATNNEWRELGKWLATLETRLFKHKSILFSDLFEVQKNSAGIMAKIKTPELHPNTENGSISLGDVGLKNLLWTDNFHPIDFEFCHESSPGRDVAQLSAHMQKTWCDSTHEPIKWLTMGYSDGGGSVSSMLRWQHEFLKYYERR